MTTSNNGPIDICVTLDVRMSNPNGDPDSENDPRTLLDGRGLVSPVSVKRKLRDLIADKDGIVWKEMQRQLDLDPDEYQILETRGRNRKEIARDLDKGTLQSKYWDARLFGETFLFGTDEQKEIAKSFEEEGVDPDKAKAMVADTRRRNPGPVQVGMGISTEPVEIERQTWTNLSGVESGKDRGMAPQAHRVVVEARYHVPIHVRANRGAVSEQDLELLLRVLPHTYRETASAVRPEVDVAHVWAYSHSRALGDRPRGPLMAELQSDGSQVPGAVDYVAKAFEADATE